MPRIDPTSLDRPPSANFSGFTLKIFASGRDLWLYQRRSKRGCCDGDHNLDCFEECKLVATIMFFNGVLDDLPALVANALARDGFIGADKQKHYLRKSPFSTPVEQMQSEFRSQGLRGGALWLRVSRYAQRLIRWFPQPFDDTVDDAIARENRQSKRECSEGKSLKSERGHFKRSNFTTRRKTFRRWAV